MKKIFYLMLVLPIILFSCESTPVAVFHTSTSDPEVGSEIFFINDSQNADRFEWDFGDGYVSNERSPGHVFYASGTYEVKLTAISKGGLEDNASITLDVKIPTLLEIEVIEYYQQYSVPDASVILYPTLADWDGETNEVYEGLTDVNGIVVFSGLDPIVHFVDVFEQNHNNYQLRQEDVVFIRTPEILPHQINRFIAYVDYIASSKGSRKGERSAIIMKLERKAADMRQPATGSSTDDWQVLFARRANQK
jgi:hypothetical protein